MTPYFKKYLVYFLAVSSIGISCQIIASEKEDTKETPTKTAQNVDQPRNETGQFRERTTSEKNEKLGELVGDTIKHNPSLIKDPKTGEKAKDKN